MSLDTIPGLLAVLVVFVALPMNWFVTLLLWRLSFAAPPPPVKVLRERAIAATAVAIIVTVFALIFLNNGMENPLLDSSATMIVTRVTLLVLSTVPALFWLRVVWRAP